MVNKSKNQTKQGQTHRPKKTSNKPADNMGSRNLEVVTSNLQPKKGMTYIDQLTQIITKNSIAVTKSNSLQLAQDKTQEQFKSSKLDYAKESECAFVDTIDYFINKFVPDVTKKLFTENSAQPVKRSDQNHFNRKERVFSSQNVRSMLTDLMIQQKEYNTKNNIFQKFKPDKNQLKQKFLKFPSQTESTDDDLKVHQSNRYNTASANEQSNSSDSECSTRTSKKKREVNKISVRHVCPNEQCQKEYNTKGKLAFHMRTKHNAENLSTSSSANEEYYKDSLKIIIPDIAISNFATPRSQLPKEDNLQLILEKQTGKNEIEKKEEVVVREVKMTKKDSFETQGLPLAQANFEKICHPYVEPSAVPDELEQIRIEKEYTPQPLSQSRKSSFLNQSIFIENNERRTEERIIEEIIRDFDNNVSEGLAKRHSIFFGFDDLDLFTPEIILSSN